MFIGPGPEYAEELVNKREKKFCQSFCAILFLCTARSGDVKAPEQRRFIIGIQREPG
jgi:hypothetical protein